MMPNKLYSKFGSGGGGSNKAMGSPTASAMPEKTANWPGVPGKASASRSAGTPQKGSMGEFYVKKVGL